MGGIPNYGALQRLEAIRTPRLIFQGDSDVMIRPHLSHLMAGLIPGRRGSRSTTTPRTPSRSNIRNEAVADVDAFWRDPGHRQGIDGREIIVARSPFVVSPPTTRSDAMTTASGRTAQEVFRHHSQAMIAGDLDAIVSDYADDARFITPAGVLHGRTGVREGFLRIFADLPDPRFEVTTRILEGDVMFLEWKAAANGSRADDGVETFVVHDGEIVLQTVHYTPRSTWISSRGRAPAGPAGRRAPGA